MMRNWWVCVGSFKTGFSDAYKPTYMTSSEEMLRLLGIGATPEVKWLILVEEFREPGVAWRTLWSSQIKIS